MPELRSNPKELNTTNLSELRKSATRNQADETRLLTIAEAAERLRTSQMFVRRLTYSGQLPIVRIGTRLVRIKESDLVKFIDERHESTEYPEEE